MENGQGDITANECTRYNDQVLANFDQLHGGDESGSAMSRRMNAGGDARGWSAAIGPDDVTYTSANGYDLQEQQLNNDLNSFASFGLGDNLYNWNTNVGDETGDPSNVPGCQTEWEKPDAIPC